MKKFWLAILMAAACAPALAQSNEIAGTVGGQAVFGSYNLGYSGVWELNPAHRVVNGGVAGLYVEVPLAWSFHDVNISPVAGLHDHYSAFFLAPGLKVKLFPQFPISPYGFVGVGLAHFHDTQQDTSSTENVVDYGAGLDWKIAPFVSIRTELRDFNSGVPSLIYPLPASRQDNLMGTVGLLVRF